MGKGHVNEEREGTGDQRRGVGGVGEEGEEGMSGGGWSKNEKQGKAECLSVGAGKEEWELMDEALRATQAGSA